MIHKKQHPEYKYRPKKRKHLKRPTERLPHEIETLAKRALLNPDHDFTANTRALMSQQVRNLSSLKSFKFFGNQIGRNFCFFSLPTQIL